MFALVGPRRVASAWHHVRAHLERMRPLSSFASCSALIEQREGELDVLGWRELDLAPFAVLLAGCDWPALLALLYLLLEVG